MMYTVLGELNPYYQGIEAPYAKEIFLLSHTLRRLMERHLKPGTEAVSQPSNRWIEPSVRDIQTSM